MKVYREYIFPWLLEHASQRFDEDRKRVLDHAKGTVLELGAGTGQTLSYYPSSVHEVFALEPELVLMQKAKSREVSGQAPCVYFIQGRGEQLPLASASVDTAVCFLVLCSVQQPVAVLQELSRVLKPGGQLLVFEHVAASEPALLRWQSRLNSIWQPLACGCHLHRDTLLGLEQAGFDCSALSRYRAPALPALVGTLLEGVAFKPVSDNDQAHGQ